MQNSKNKEALRLAEWLERPEHDGSVCTEHIESATELRRMHDLLGKADALCRIRAARIAELEARMEVDARHPYDGIDCRDATIAELQAGYDAARLEIASLNAQLEAVGAGGVEPLRKRECLHKISEPVQPLVCDYCGALTPDPWHSSGMLHGKMSKHIHSCDACAARGAAQAAPVDAAVQQDAERYRWLRDHRGWQVLHRIRPGKSIEYRMRDDGDWWGSWWPTHEQAIDAAIAAQQGGTA